jgi:hypothetical protein
MLPNPTAATASIPFHPHHDGRIVVHPISDPSCAIDVTESVIHCIASSIEDAVGGNPVLNRLEAERAVQELTRVAQRGLVEASR